MQRAKVDAGGFGDAFDAVVVSRDVGVGKPDPGIFAAAEERLPADSYVFVADALDRDVRAAEAAGWRGVYVGDETPRTCRTSGRCRRFRTWSESRRVSPSPERYGPLRGKALSATH